MIHMSNWLMCSPQHGYYGVNGGYKSCFKAMAGKYTRVACPDNLSNVPFVDSPKDSKLYQAGFFNPYFSDMMQRINAFLNEKLAVDKAH